MPLDITTLYAGLLGLWLLTLVTRVIRRRWATHVAWGDGGDRTLNRRIRAVGNLIEYAPMFLILLALLEMQGLPGWSLHIIGLAFLTGRLAHGWNFAFTEGALPLRMVGTTLTLTALGIATLAALALSFV